jgi:hypothetical protein
MVEVVQLSALAANGGAAWADAQLPHGRLRAEALAGQAQRPGIERLVVFTPFVRRRPVDFGCHNRRNISPFSVRLA